MNQDNDTHDKLTTMSHDKILESINSNSKYYHWGDMPIIYDTFLMTSFKYYNNEWSEMNIKDFQDYADEVTDPNKIDALFTDKIKQDYKVTLKEVYNRVKKYIASESVQRHEEKPS